MTAEPGNPLAVIEAYTGFAQPWVPDLVFRWLCDAFTKARYARLGQAGHDSSARLTLAQVFTDIEIDAALVPPTTESKADEQACRPGFVAQMLRRSIAGPSSMLEHLRHVAQVAKGLPVTRLDQDVLVIGGPGQGKSTTGQYLAQLHRAAILRQVHARLVSDEELTASLREIEAQVENDKLGWPVQNCLPAHIVLGELATWMVSENAKPKDAVLGFLIAQIRQAADADLPLSDMRALLALVPWLVIFDGLDEVPVSGERAQVAEAIDDFRNTVARASVLQPRTTIVITTRPQGHDPQRTADCTTVHLQPFTPERALAYARKLVDHRYPPDRQEIVWQRLEQACFEAATAKLMQSPLQVTIMAALVDRLGRPPHQRWQLFRDYYRVIYERELERPHGPAATLLRAYRTHIDVVHEQIGLLLQAQSEELGGGDALLERAQLERVVDEHLDNEGFAPTERQRLIDEIVRVATDRLVFLVSPRTEHFGFELRSFQEFMAAQALMHGRDQQVEERLRAIAGLSLWRNVLLFAASRCVAEVSHLRDFIAYQLVPGLANTGVAALDQTRMLAAELALDLLEDRSWDYSPKHLQALADEVMALLRAAAPDSRHARLASLEQDPVQTRLQVYLEEKWTGHADEHVGWTIAMVLANRGADWARALVEQYFSASKADAQGDILWQVRKLGRPMGEWLASVILRHLWCLEPATFSWTPKDFEQPIGDSTARAGLFLMTSAWILRHSTKFARVADGTDAFGYIPFIPFDAHFWQILDLKVFEAWPETPSAWQPGISAARFAREPTLDILADELERLAPLMDDGELAARAIQLPWPLGACLASTTSAEELRALAREIRLGHLGSLQDWAAMETRWQKQGIPWSHLLAVENQWPCKWNASNDAVPDVRACSRVSLRGLGDEHLASVLAAFEHARDPRLLNHWTQLLWENLYLVDKPRLDAFDPPERFAALLEGEWFRSIWMTSRLLHELVQRARHDPAWLAVLERVGWSIPAFGQSSSGAEPEQTLALLADLCHVHPQHHGLLVLLAKVLMHTEGDVDCVQPLAIPDLGDRRMHLYTEYLAARWGRRTRADIETWLAEIIKTPSAFTELGLGWVELLLRMRAAHNFEDYLASLDRWHQMLAAMHNPHADYILSRLREAWTRRPSGLGRTEVWNQLALPAPSPTALSEPPSQLAPAANVADAHETSTLASNYIERIKVHDMRGIARLELELPAVPQSPTEGRWIVFLGENGTGKSTLLRALVLALAEPDVAAGLVADSVAPFVRHGSDLAEAVAVIQSARFTARLRMKEGREEYRDSDPTQAERPLIFAYGCGRGSAIGGPDREVAYSETARVTSLFDESHALISAETWLKFLQLDALQKKGEYAERLENVKDALEHLLPGVKKIDIDSRGVWFTGSNVGERVSLSGLSDGYLTTIGWVIDLMARWLQRMDQRRSKDPNVRVPADFTRHMQGIVFVDEIDLHLHPRWQLEVICDLRAVFPRMSFVITTHNPLTLLGTKPGELYVVRHVRPPVDARDTEAELEVVACEPPVGLRADQVLTGAWFGLATTLDPGSLDLLEKHRQLLRAGTSDNVEERRKLEQELRQRLGSFAETPIERLAQEVAAEVVDESYGERSPEERMAIRQRFKAMINERRKQRMRKSD